MVPEQVVVDFVERYREAFEPIQASFFEWGVAFTLWWFREAGLDIAVIETGMGGRLDSTNVVTPEVSVITNTTCSSWGTRWRPSRGKRQAS